VTQQPPALSNSRTSTFAFSSPDATATFRCTLNGSTPQTCVSPVVYTNLSDATRTLLIQAVDPAGNVDTQAQPIMWTVDATPPDTTLTPPTHYAANTEPTFSFSSSEAGSTFQCSLGHAAFAPCTSPDIVFVPRSGQHRFRVRAVDAAGNADPTPAVFKWTSDVTPPRRPRVFLFPAPVASASGVQPFPSGSPGLSLITTTPLQQIVIRPPLFTLATSLQAQWSSPDPTAVAYDAWVTTAADGLPASAGPVFKQLTDTTSKALKIRPGTGKSVCIHVDARDHLGNKSRVVVRCTTIPARVTPAPVVGRWVKSNGAWGGHYVQIALGHGYYVPSAIQGFPSPDFLAIVAEQCASCGTLKIGFAQNPTDPIQHLFRTLDLTGRQRRGNARPFIVRLPRARLRGLGSGVVLIIATSGKVRLSGIGVALAHE
jgi:hypothetical protein